MLFDCTRSMLTRALFASQARAACIWLNFNRSASTSVKGWIYAVREHRDVNFLDVADGVQSKHVQVVASDEIVKRAGRLRFGDCVVCEGDYVASSGPRQKTEFRATSIVRVAENNVESLSAVASLEQIRQSQSMRPKHPLFAALMRFRSRLANQVRSHFQRAGYVEISCPVLTTSNCEAADCFVIGQSRNAGNVEGGRQKLASTSQEELPASARTERSSYFGDQRVLLTGSAQFHLEAFSTGFSRTYSFAHTFRAEPSRTRHHLAEFSMIEAEICFIDSLDGLLQEIERFFRSIVEGVLSDEESLADLRTIEERLRFDGKLADKVKSGGSKVASRRKSIEMQLRDTLSKPFERISYADALKVLAANNSRFVVKVDASNPVFDIQKEHEKFLVRHFNGTPVFLTDFPASLKPFYMQTNRATDEGKIPGDRVETAACADLLVAGVGELIGGSVRENDLATLEQRAAKVGHTQSQREAIDWYLQLRRAGLPPHAGYGVGFERLMQFVLDVPNIRDVVPFYRYYGSCEL